MEVESRPAGTHQAGEGVAHAVLQRASLQGGEEGGVVEARRRCRDQLLHPLTLAQVQTCTQIHPLHHRPPQRHSGK